MIRICVIGTFLSFCPSLKTYNKLAFQIKLEKVFTIAAVDVEANFCGNYGFFGYNIYIYIYSYS